MEKEVRLIIDKNVKVKFYKEGPEDFYKPAIIDDLYFSKKNRLRYIYIISDKTLNIYSITGNSDNKQKTKISYIEAARILSSNRIVLPVKKTFVGYIKFDGQWGYVEHIINLKNNKQIISAEFELDKSIYNSFKEKLTEKFGKDNVVEKSLFDLIKD